MVSSPLTLCQWSHILGVSTINFLIVIILCSAQLNKKFFIVGLLLSIGVLIHEAIVFYGVPIVLFLEFLNFKNFNLNIYLY